MKKRYYLSMLSVFPLILLFDVVYLILHQSFDIFYMTVLAHFILFGLLNFPGTFFLYKPIDSVFIQNEDTKQARKRIHRLTWYSTWWIFFLGIAYVAYSLFFLFFFVAKTDVVSTDKMPPIFYLSMISSSLFVFAIFPAFTTYFLINDFILDLKEKAFINFRIMYPVGKKRIGLTLLFVFIILGFLPTALVILDLLVFSSVQSQYGDFTSFSLVGSVLVDRFIVLAGMVFAIILVTRSFTKPIYSLLKTINKVSEGDYSTRAAVIADDEIGLLTKNFNSMVHELEVSHHKQEEYSHTLEKNVEQLNKEIVERQSAEKLARQQQEKLFQSEKMASVGTLVSGVAHEINNPNNFILLNSDNLADVWEDLIPFLDTHAKDRGDFMIAGLMYSEIRDEVSMIINGIKEGSERIKKIVLTLKDFARKDPGNLDQVVDIPNVIDDSVTILTSLIKKSTDRFTIQSSKNLLKIKGNIQQIEQVIINLISNACHSLENRNRKISVSTDSDNKSAIITVQDEGIGISPEDLKYIMDPFFTTKRDSGGTGLGLSISYNIIKTHGGELIIKSKVGVGTTATIKLPI
jgi:signal transduction histidine kinase